MEKRCPKCDTWKPGSEFYKTDFWEDGLCFYCKECERKRSRAAYKRRQERSDTIRYHLTHCPKDSWGYQSSFTGIEIHEMLRHNCLYPGTRFRQDKKEYVVTEDKRMVRL